MAQVDPTEIGVDRAMPGVLSGGWLPPYVRRIADEELLSVVRGAVWEGGPWLVVATGASKVGKSRSLYEALLRCVPEFELVAPVDADAVRVLAADDGKGEHGRVLWLDDLEPFLAQGLTLRDLAEWRASSGAGVVAATSGDIVPSSGIAGDLVTFAAEAEMLDFAALVSIQNTTRQELDPLRAELGGDVLGAIEEHGLAAFLVAGPELVRKLTTGRHESEWPCPEGRAVVLAAIDWARCGREDPIPASTLRGLWVSYLPAGTQDSDDGFAAGLEWALRTVRGTIALLLKEKGGYRAYDYTVQFMEDMGDASAPQDVVWARAIDGANNGQALAVGSRAYAYGNLHGALTAFKAASRSDTIEVAVTGRLYLALTLRLLNRNEEAISVSDEIFANFSQEASLADQVAGALLNKGFSLTNLQRYLDAIAVYDDLLWRFGEQNQLREIVAEALVGKAIAFSELDDPSRALEAYDELLARFSDAPEMGLRDWVARALLGKGRTLHNMGMVEDAIAAYDDLLHRFEAAPDPAFAPFLAGALSGKAVSLAALGHQDEAIVAYEAIVTRYGDTYDPALRRLAARARYSSGLMLVSLGRETEAITAFEDLEARYGESADPELREIVKDAQTGRSLALGTLKRSDSARGRDAEAFERATAAEARRLELDFERNLKEPIRMRGLKLAGLEVFADANWKLHPSINLLLGRNGYGKSLLLRILAGILQRDANATGELFPAGQTDGVIGIDLRRGNARVGIERNRFAFSSASLGKVPVLAIPDVRVMDQSITTLSEPESLNLAIDGALHFLSRKPYQSAVEAFLGGLVMDYWEHGKSFDLPSFALINEVLKRLADQSLEFRSVERVGRTGSRVWVRTEGLKRDIELQRASQGTLSVITMFGIVHSFLQELAVARGDDPREARHQTAIVLIDEVDAHLHPTWQRKIRNALVDTFPQVQFVLTAHSPLVVTGCGPDEVSVLRSSSQGFELEQLQQDFVGASVQDVYLEIFDTEDVDENFLRYASLKARGGEVEIEHRLDALFEKERQQGLTEEEHLLTQHLLRDSHRISRVEEVNAQRHDAEALALEKDAEIRHLETELRHHRASEDGQGG